MDRFKKALLIGLIMLGFVWGNSISAEATVTASISPEKGTVAAEVTVIGTCTDEAGSGTSTTVWIDFGQYPTIASTTSTAAGTFSGVFTIPLAYYGSHTITVYTEPVGSSTVSFFVQSCIRQITPVSATAGNSITVCGDGYDATETIHIVFGTIGTVTVTTSDDTGSFTAAFTVEDTWAYGTETVTAYGMNDPTNHQRTRTFLVDDKTAPASSVTTPINGGCIGTLSEISGVATDNLSGVERVEIAIKNSDGEFLIEGDTPSWGTQTTWLDVFGTTAWSYSSSGIVWDDGSYTIQSRAIDTAGNTETPATSNTFTYDKTPPVIASITITSDKPTYFYNPGLTGTGGTVYFNSLSGKGAGQILTVTVDWTDDNKGSLSGASAFGGTPTTDIDDEGSWTQTYLVGTDASTQQDIIFTVIDKAGNIATASITFIQDNVAPTCEVTSIAESSDYLYSPDLSQIYFGDDMTTPQTITITGTSTDDGSGLYQVTYSTLLGDSPPAGTSSWEAQYTAEGTDADGVITITATDMVGNTQTVQVTVTQDTGNPIVDITGVTTPHYDPDGIATNTTDNWYDHGNLISGFSGTCIVNDAVAGLSNGTLTFDHSVGTCTQEINCGTGGTFTVTNVSDDADGTITVTIAMRDNVGNVETDSLIIRFDNTNPSILSGGWVETSEFMYVDNNGTLTFSNIMGDTIQKPKLMGMASDAGSGLQKAVFSNEPSLNRSPGDDSTLTDGWAGEYYILAENTGSNSPAVVTIFDHVGNFATANYNYCEDLTFAGTITIHTQDSQWFAILTPTIDVDFYEDKALCSGYYGVNGTSSWYPIPGFTNLTGTTSFTSDFTIDHLNQGTSTIYFKATDGTGNEYFATDTLIMRIDTTPPALPQNLTAAGSNPSPWSATATFTIGWINPADTCGIKGIWYKLGVPSSATDGTFTAANPFNLQVPSEGTHALYVWLEDNVGNKTHFNAATVTLRYDPTPPALPQNLTAAGSNPSPWSTTATFTIAWENPVDTCGIKGIWYKLGVPQSATDGIFTADKPFNLQVPSEGIHILYVWLEDNTGNSNYLNAATVTLRYDPTPPALPQNLTAAGSNPSPWSATATFTIGWKNPSDTCGIKDVWYKLGVPQSATDGISTADNPFDLQVPSEGIHTLYVWLEDNVGNKTHFNAATVTLRYDPTPPTPIITYSSHPDELTWYNTNTTAFKWTADDISGIIDYRYILDAASATIPTESGSRGTSTSTSYSSISDGIWYFHLQAQNGAELWSDTLHYLINIDRTSPTNPATCSAWTDKGKTVSIYSDTWQKIDNTPYFEWSGAEDISSGISEYAVYWGPDPLGTPTDYSENYSNKGNYEVITPVPSPSTYTLRIKTKDRAGNWGSASTLFAFNYGQLAPVTPGSLTVNNGNQISPWTSSPAFTINWQNPSHICAIKGAWYKLDSEPRSSTDGTFTGTVTQLFTIPLKTEGIHTLYVWLEDYAGNKDHNNSGSVTLRYDFTPPKVERICPNKKVVNHCPKISAWLSDGIGEIGTITVLIDGNEIMCGTEGFDSSMEQKIFNFSKTSPPLSEGDHSVEIIVWDKAGNKSAPVTATFTVSTEGLTELVTYPNPFSSGQRTFISYVINKTAKVTINIYDVSCRIVDFIEVGIKDPGTYKEPWHGLSHFKETLPNGIYICEIIVEEVDSGNKYKKYFKMAIVNR